MRGSEGRAGRPFWDSHLMCCELTAMGLAEIAWHDKRCEVWGTALVRAQGVPKQVMSDEEDQQDVPKANEDNV